MARTYRHPETGLVLHVNEGFNWQVALFGGWWYLDKGMSGQGLLWIALQLPTLGLIGLYLASRANDDYARWLMEKGYVLATG